MFEFLLFCLTAIFFSVILIFFKKRKVEKATKKLNIQADFLSKVFFQIILEIDHNYSFKYKKWDEIHSWLNLDICEDIGYIHQRKIQSSFIAYLSRGISPSKKLEPMFKEYKNFINHKDYMNNIPPENIIDIFDSIFINNFNKNESPKSSKKEINIVKSKIYKLLNHYRIEIFISSIWIIIMSSILYIFDPLDINSYEWYKEEYFKNIYLLTIPIQFFIIKIVYLKYIK